MNKPPLTIRANSGLSPEVIQTACGPVEYLDLGRGPVVVTLHGAIGGYDQSMILAKAVLQGDFRVSAISCLSYPGTPISAGKTPTQQADLVAALLDALEIECAALIAISGGGPCAILFALRHPRRCNALVLISTVKGKNCVTIPFSFYIMKFLARIPIAVRTMRQKALNDQKQAAARSIKKPLMPKRMASNSVARSLFGELIASTFDRMAHRITGTNNDIAITRNTEYPLENITVSTMIVHGDCDPLVRFEERAKTAAARIAGAELLVLEGGAHAAIFTHQQQVTETVSRFLTAV